MICVILVNKQTHKQLITDELISYLGVVEDQLVELDTVLARLESSAVLYVDLTAQCSRGIVNTDNLQTVTTRDGRIVIFCRIPDSVNRHLISGRFRIRIFDVSSLYL